jgi:heterotetrameric sarcosine oxidase gamma subunit
MTSASSETVKASCRSLLAEGCPRRSMLRVVLITPHHVVLPEMVGALGGLWPNQVGLTATANFRVLCTGPSEWLVIESDTTSHAVRALLSIEATQLIRVEIGDSLALLTLSGDLVTDLLASACALDTHTASFAVDDCRCTRFAGLKVVIDRRSNDVFDCYVPASYCGYAREFLKDVAFNVGLKLA